MPDCLLKPIDNKPNHFTATAGKLTLSLTDIVGTTQINPMDTSVVDTTNPAAPTAVTPTAISKTSFTLDLVQGKRYLISFTFIQIEDQFAASADLKEACGALIDTIDITGLFNGYVVGVA